jgi:twitching motility two-component system response regulator PilG
LVVKISPRSAKGKKDKRMGNTVLVIDDSLTVRTILQTSLHRAGFAASSFPDGIQAMQALTEGRIPVPDAIILDVGLPKMDGYAIARALKRQRAFKSAIIIMLSGHDRSIDKLHGRLVGANAYITKPFQPAHLLEILCAHLVSQNRFSLG